MPGLWRIPGEVVERTDCAVRSANARGSLGGVAEVTISIRARAPATGRYESAVAIAQPEVRSKTSLALGLRLLKRWGLNRGE